MKANELVVGKKYWCGWAGRSAWFVRLKLIPGVEKLKKSQSSAMYAIVISSATLNK